MNSRGRGKIPIQITYFGKKQRLVARSFQDLICVRRPINNQKTAARALALYKKTLALRLAQSDSRATKNFRVQTRTRDRFSLSWRGGEDYIRLYLRICLGRVWHGPFPLMSAIWENRQHPDAVDSHSHGRPLQTAEFLTRHQSAILSSSLQNNNKLW